jgi:hypothetical protein
MSAFDHLVIGVIKIGEIILVIDIGGVLKAGDGHGVGTVAVIQEGNPDAFHTFHQECRDSRPLLLAAVGA